MIASGTDGQNVSLIKHGYCLCGKHYDDIMYIDEIREEMEEKAKSA